MLRLPARFAAVILCFAPLFRQLTWQHAQVLLIGAILVPGQRTVTNILRMSGLCWERRFVNYHRVLNRAAWSGRAAARVLLALLLDAFVPKGPVLLGLDDHIERRRGKCISAKGIYRDAVGSDPLGRSGLGLALPDRARPLGALQPRARQATQEADGLGTAAGPASPPLDARAKACLRGRQQFRRSRTPRRPRPAGRERRHPSAARCRALHPGPAAPAQDQGAPSQQGRAPADPGQGTGRSGHAMAARDRARLVRRGRACERDLFRYRRLAPCWPAGRADPLGAAARPQPAVRPTGPALHRPDARAAADPALVHAALAAGGHIPRSP